jgi:membrane protein DedA with SNARE-associated domain
MLQWFASFTTFVFNVGYPGVVLALIIEGLGLPFPGDACMAFYGIAAANGNFGFWGVFVCSIIGYTIGTSVAYGVARRWGSGWLASKRTSRLISMRSMRRTTHLMDRFGPFLLIPGRFLPGVRSVSSYVAGLGNMAFRDFVLYTMVSAVLWCGTWVSIGYWFGEHLDIIMRMAQHTLAWITGALVISLFFYWLWHRQSLQRRH